MLEQGTLAITARGDGNRWYGRVSIPESVARSAGLTEGMRVTARCADGSIVIQSDEQGRIKFPPAKGKCSPRHAFEAATATLGLRDTHLSQCPSQTEVEPGLVRIKVPEDCLATDVKARKKARKDPPRSDGGRGSSSVPLRIGGNGPAAALATEASRAGRTVQTMSIDQLAALLTSHGMTVERFGPRFFRIDGKSATSHDLVEAATKATGATESNRIVLIVDE